MMMCQHNIEADYCGICYIQAQKKFNATGGPINGFCYKRLRRETRI